MAYICNTPILWSSSLLLVQSRPDAFKAITCILIDAILSHKVRLKTTIQLSAKRMQLTSYYIIRAT